MKIVKHMLLTGKHLSASEVLRAESISQIVPDIQLMTEATTLANKINENSRIAGHFTKELIARSIDLRLEYQYSEVRKAGDLHDIVSAKLRDFEDYRSKEGSCSFVGKRKPFCKGR